MASITVTGTATRSFYDGKGLEVSESYKNKQGETKTRKYTVWFNEPHNIQDGASIKVEGLLSAEIESFTTKEGEDRQFVKLTVNNPTILGAPKAELVDAPF